MIATILSPGPSLSLVTEEETRDTTIIGVNRAVRYMVCDWWVFSDDRVYRNYPSDYTLKVFTNEETQRRLNRKFDLTHESLYHKYTPGWHIYSFTAAVILAAELGADTVRVFGCDWKGCEDFDGHRYQFPGETAELTRTADRWQREREVFDKTITLIPGVRVERIIRD